MGRLPRFIGATLTLADVIFLFSGLVDWFCNLKILCFYSWEWKKRGRLKGKIASYVHDGKIVLWAYCIPRLLAVTLFLQD
jgi:hypothetical protein